MYRSPQQRFRRSLRLVGVGVLVFALLTPIESAQASAVQTQQQPKFTAAAAFDVSAPLREVAPRTRGCEEMNENS